MIEDIKKLYDLSIDMMCIAGTDGHFKQINPAFERTLGLRTEELLSKPFFEFIHPDDIEATQREIEKLEQGVPTIAFENRYRCGDGTYKHLLWTCHPDPETGALYAVARDISERKRADERFRLVLEASPIAMIMIDDEGRFTFVNRATERLFGYARDELIGRPLEILLPERKRSAHASFRKQFMAAPVARAMGEGLELTALRKDASEFPVEIGLGPIQIGESVSVLASVVDLSARKEVEDKTLALALELDQANRRLVEIAATDSLTGLRTRGAFLEEMSRHMALARRHGHPLSLLLADVDRFKQYNDAFGHPAGDELLKSLGELLNEAPRESDLVGRYGGEEFIIGMPETDYSGSLVLAERIRSATAERSWPNRQVTASIGIATLDVSGQDSGKDADAVTVLIEQADQALYHSKRTGRNRVTHARDLTTDSPSAAKVSDT